MARPDDIGPHHLPNRCGKLAHAKQQLAQWPNFTWPRWPIVEKAVVEEEEMDLSVPSPLNSPGPAPQVSPLPLPLSRVLLRAPPSPFLDSIRKINIKLQSQISRVESKPGWGKAVAPATTMLSDQVGPAPG